MHLSESQIKTYLDGQCTQNQIETVASHLQSCSTCASRLEELRAQAMKLSALLSPLQPQNPPLNPQKAFSRLLNRPKESIMTTFYKKPAFAFSVVLAALLISLAFPPVRAFASDVLALFRVDKVQVVTYDPAYMKQFMNGAENSRGQFEAFFNESITETHQGAYQSVTNKAEAESISGFTPRLPSLENGQLGVEPGSEISITLDTELINTMLGELGFEEYAISPEFSGSKVNVFVPPSVVYTSGNCEEALDATDPDDFARLDCLTFVQMRAPQADGPDGLDVSRLGEALFQVMGMPKSEAVALSQSIDWSTTLVLPVPVGGSVDYQEVSVDGVQGAYIFDKQSSLQTLIWSKNGMLYAMNATKPELDLIALANDLH